MRGVNTAILVGTLGRDPETRTFDNGGSVCNFSIATSESWTDKNTNERVEQTEWHRIVINGRLAEVAQQYLKKGSKVYIQGSLRTRKYTKDGVECQTTEIRAISMQMLDSPNQSGQNANNEQSGANNGTNNRNQQSNNRSQQGNGQNQGNNGQHVSGNKSPNGYTYNQGYGNSNQQPQDLDNDLPF